MIEKVRLDDWIVDNWVMFDKHGDRVDGPVPTNSGPAALLVEDVTEALKRVDGDHVTDSVDRSQMWRVSAIVLNRVVVDKLPETPMTVDQLLEAVRATGLAWYISPTSSP